MRGVGRTSLLLVFGAFAYACSTGDEEPAAAACPHPQEVTPGSGWIQCDNGIVHRPKAGTCVTYEPTSETFPPSTLPDEDECYADADCVAHELGYCQRGYAPYAATPTANHCVYACVVDTNCPSGELCACSETRGDCRPATCKVDSECGEGFLCVESPPSCLDRPTYSCQTPDDACFSTTDCPMGLYCGGGQYGPRSCVPPPCAA